MGVKQEKWTPTTRRGPIAAEMKSPAPNSVDLPPLLGLFNYHYYFIFSFTDTPNHLKQAFFFVSLQIYFKFTVNIRLQI